eukprot:scaffold52309_cov60-Phaeocystis_antarctica.AAC.2
MAFCPLVCVSWTVGRRLALRAVERSSRASRAAASHPRADAMPPPRLALFLNPWGASSFSRHLPTLLSEARKRGYDGVEMSLSVLTRTPMMGPPYCTYGLHAQPPACCTY